MGRGPVCGMMTRRTGAAGTSGTTGSGGGGGATGAATGAGAATFAGGRATTTPEGGVLLAIAGRSGTGWPGRTTTPCGGREAIAGEGRAAGCVTVGAWRAWGTILRGASPTGAASVRGCAMRRVGITGVVRGTRGGSAGEAEVATAAGATGAAEATGACGAGGRTGAATTGAACVGRIIWGSTMRGAGGAAETLGGAEAPGVDATGGGLVTGAEGAGGTTTAATGAAVDTGAATTGFGAGTTETAGLGAFAAAWSACRRSRMARAMSPGLDALEKSTFCLASVAAAADLTNPLRPPVRWPRTFSASSSSMDELWVFFSVTPTAVSASRILLLLTSSSRARSLILTLLIRPFSFSRS